MHGDSWVSNDSVKTCLQDPKPLHMPAARRGSFWARPAPHLCPGHSLMSTAHDEAGRSHPETIKTDHEESYYEN